MPVTSKWITSLVYRWHRLLVYGEVYATQTNIRLATMNSPEFFHAYRHQYHFPFFFSFFASNSIHAHLLTQPACQLNRYNRICSCNQHIATLHFKQLESYHIEIRPLNVAFHESSTDFFGRTLFHRITVAFVQKMAPLEHPTESMYLLYCQNLSLSLSHAHNMDIGTACMHIHSSI